jgi:hypothetical protein
MACSFQVLFTIHTVAFKEAEPAGRVPPVHTTADNNKPVDKLT